MEKHGITGCIFCRIANKQQQAYVVREDEAHIAFLSIFPNTEGVTVVIPKQHYPSYVFELEETVLNKLMQFAKVVAKQLDEAFEDVGRTALVFEGFGIDHVHAKLFPMHGTQHLTQNWQAVHSPINSFSERYEGYISSHDCNAISQDELAQTAQKIRAFLK